MARPTALLYEYVNDILERRGEYRDEHLGLIGSWSDDGRLALAGPLGEGPRGALFVFEVDDPSEVEAFVDADPYVSAGLVTAHRIEPWTLVASRPLLATGD